MQPIDPADVAGWISAIEQIPSGQCYCPPFLKPLHLVTLGLAAKRSGWNHFNLPSHLENYAARMNLWESVNMNSLFKTQYSPDGKFLPVQRFDKDKRNVQHVADELIKIVIKTTSHEYQNALSNCLEEIVNNFFDHANADAELPCLVAAQSWPQGKLIQIAIADAGMGIRDSLSENKELRTQLIKNNACRIAAQYGVTSKPNNNHSGYGLTLAKDLMEQAGGTFLLLSGKELFSHRQTQEISTRFDGGWNGTLLVLEWKIDAPLNSKTVYDSWPMPKGFSADDFF